MEYNPNFENIYKNLNITDDIKTSKTHKCKSLISEKNKLNKNWLVRSSSKVLTNLLIIIILVGDVFHAICLPLTVRHSSIFQALSTRTAAVLKFGPPTDSVITIQFLLAF